MNMLREVCKMGTHNAYAYVLRSYDPVSVKIRCTETYAENDICFTDGIPTLSQKILAKSIGPKKNYGAKSRQKFIRAYTGKPNFVHIFTTFLNFTVNWPDRFSPILNSPKKIMVLPVKIKN